jgi:hypothetical protein
MPNIKAPPPPLILGKDKQKLKIEGNMPDIHTKK